MKKVLWCLVVLMVGACAGTAPTSFYNLSSYDNGVVKVKNVRKVSVGIDFVVVPGYLERPQIVTIKGDNELDLSEFDRWAEPLSNSMQRVIATNIASVMTSATVRPATSNRRSFDYIVLVEINKFDGKFGEKAVLEAWWTVNGKGNVVAASEQSKYELPLGEGYDELVAKQSELVNMLSQDIAKKIAKLK